MKKRLTALMWLISVLPLATPAAQAGQRHALLIGISNYSAYNDSGLFPDLDCDEDVREIKAALVTTFHFDPSPAAGEIVTLTSGGVDGEPRHAAQTRRAAILAALQHLVDVTGPGDLVYIHYSGHGDQVLDPTEPGGLDSTIVPADYACPAPDKKKTDPATLTDPANEICGKVILGYIHQIQAKLRGRGQLVLSFDSCHSESVARGVAPTAKKRGSSFTEYVTWYKQKHPDYAADPTPAVDDTPPATADAGGGAARGGRMLVRGLTTGSAWQDLRGSGYVVIAACQNADCAYETDDQPYMGRLSYCLARVLARARADTTYQQVFDQVNALFHAKYDDQFPQLDGDPNTTLFGGTATPPPPSIPVFVKAAGVGTLQAGTLQDMSIDSVFALYPKDAAQSPDTEVAEAKITEADLTAATLTVTKVFRPFKTPTELGAVETQHNYATPPLSFDADSLRRVLPAQAPAILAQIQGMVSTTSTPADVRVAEAPPAAGARGPSDPALVDSASGRALAILDISRPDLPQQVADALSDEAMYRYACQLGDGQQALNAAFQMALRVVPVQVGQDAGGHDVIQSYGQPLTAGQALPLGGHFVIQVRNTSGRPLHLTILDLTGDHKVSVAWSATPDHEGDNLLAPTAADKWATLWVGSDVQDPAIFQATSADPDEIVKAIATTDFVDFSALATRGPQGPFEQLVSPALRARGFNQDTNVAVPPQSWTATTYGFRIQ